MFEMFETYGKQITAFIAEAKELLTAMKAEIAALRTENAELKAQVTRIEGAHMLLMEWISDIDDSEASELAAVAEAAAAEASAAAVVAAAAAETVVEETEVTPEPLEEEMQETVPPAHEEHSEIPPGETPPGLTETPVPAGETVPPEEQPLKKSKRTWI
jgi:hypothetical protein